MSHAGGREPVSDGSFSPRPRVRLVGAFAEPFNTAIAAARTCYASRLIAPEDVARDEAARAQRDAIARSTYAAGHHTIWQHATFEFALENVSRQLIWSFLHAHPFYNSEQVSQRYVTVQAGAVLTPSLPPRARARYTRAVEMQVTAYQRLVELLLEPARQAYFALFPARAKQPEKYRSAVVKKAQEIARYTLPVGTLAYLYHTVNGLTLHRYHRLCNMLDAPGEARAVVSAMVEAVRAQRDAALRDTSRLELLIRQNYRQLDTRCKELMDALKITARNVFRRLLEVFRPLYDNYRDDHLLLRLLTRCSGIVRRRGQTIRYRAVAQGSLPPGAAPRVRHLPEHHDRLHQRPLPRALRPRRDPPAGPAPSPLTPAQVREFNLPYP